MPTLAKPRDRTRAEPIEANAYYDTELVIIALNLRSRRCLSEAVKNKEIRYTIVGNQKLFRGQWIMDWLERRAEGPVSTAGLLREQATHAETIEGDGSGPA